MKPRAGLVLTGGGARAAYQVGVLKAVRDILGNPARNPFPILCGTSAGAINAATLAVHADDYSRAVAELLEVWEHMRCDHVYRTDFPHIMKSGARWLLSMMLVSRSNPVSLLDNAPLRGMLEKGLAFERIQQHIDAGALYAVCVTASGYTSGQSVSFFQGGSGQEGWERNQRIGAAVVLQHEYLLASSALPFIFPAVKLHREYFGDGSMRQIAPVSPALHL
ncbi:MAG: patatin-like phospholipase family protein, partial [Burkholderiales bacterium]